jgi:putative transposase
VSSGVPTKEFTERVTTMAGPHNVDPAGLLGQHLTSASPDLLGEMMAAFTNAMMSAQADQICGASYGERGEAQQPGATGTGRGSGTPESAPSSCDPEAARSSYSPDCC